MKQPQKKLTLLQKINPINKDQEKRKFFFDPLYNPQFEYLEDVSLEDWMKYGPAATEFLPAAQHILDSVLKQWGTESQYLADTEGEVLTQEAAQAEINDYLKKNSLEKEIVLVFSPKQTARTLMRKNVLSIRTPIQYRQRAIIGMLNHELGTHYFRGINEKQQPWHGQHQAFGLGAGESEDGFWSGSYLETEEGLAVINSNASLPDKHLWFPALSYLSVNLAKELSFSELFHELKRYTDDRDRRWSLSLKAKRGLRDTSLPGAFTKNQLYFSGAIKTLHWLKENNFAAEKLYLGKISLDDVEQAKEIAQFSSIRLPSFLNDREKYRDAVKKIIALNKLESWLK